MPGVFTTLGIFGTFVGLLQGVLNLSSRFGSSDPEQMKEGIVGLMQGMGTAFLTSIVGIVLALIWMRIDRTALRKAEQASHHFCDAMQHYFPVLTDDGMFRHMLEIAV